MNKQSKSRNVYFSERVINAVSGIFDYPLTIVEAPMGYGKTTAVQEYLNNTDVTVLWQKIYDNSITAFWTGFCNLISELDVDCSNSLLLLGFPNNNIAKQETLRLVRNIKLTRKTVIVIDDYHLINTAETNKLIEYLAVNKIPKIFIVLTARFVEFSDLEEMVLKGYLNYITKETLEFLPKDIIRYYKLCGINIKSIEADELYTFTEGWISALYLLMLKFDLDNSYLFKDDIYTLIDKVVYMPFAENYRDFLVSMCIFDSFTISQAAYVWNDENASLILEELVSKNAFVTYDYNKKNYYMHSILRKFMEGKLEDKDQCYKNTLYKNAAKWYMEKEEYLTSMHYAYSAGDFDSLLKAVELDKGNSINSEFKDLIIKYFEECPNESKERFPIAMLVYMRRLFSFNEIEMFKKACGEFMANMQNIDSVDDDYKNRLLGEFELLLSFTGYNDIEKMSEYHRRACNLLKEPSTILDLKGSWTFGSPSVLYMFHRKSGELEKEVQTIKYAMPLYYQVTNSHGKGAELVMEAERYFYIGNFENSEIVAYKAYQAANENSQSGIVICSIFLQIRLAFIKGDFYNILQLFNKIRVDIKNKKLYLFMHTLDMCEAYIYSYLNIKELVPAWISKGEFKNTRLMFPSMAFLNIVYGRVLLMNGEYLKLIGSSDNFIETASVFPNILGQIYTYIYLSAANRQIFRQDDALENLKKALEIAMPDKVYMPFVENCDFIKPMLQALYSHGVYIVEIARILQLHERYLKAVGQITRDYFLENKPKLTERENEIAKLAAQGFSNIGIGERLFISQNTVKTQLKSVFEKLGVNSRSLLKQYFNKES